MVERLTKIDGDLIPEEKGPKGKDFKTNGEEKMKSKKLIPVWRLGPGWYSVVLW